MSHPDERPDEAAAQPEPVVVGIGASAGGLAALRTFFAHVPKGSELAYVVVVHLDPKHESHLADLLQPSVDMPVIQVTGTVALEPNQVYVIPPGSNLSTIDTHLRLTELEERRRERAPIDHFFRTLAETHDGHAIGVILSGTGSDGTLGIKKIKERGGLAVAQDPAEAEYDGMPQSAIATSLVDLVLPLAEIPEAIHRYARTDPRLPALGGGEEAVEESEQRLLSKIFAQIRARTDRDFSRYKRTTILRRIQRRMQMRAVEELSAYLDLLCQDGDEVQALADDMLITVTSFFRDPETHEVLKKKIVPKLFEGKGTEDELRVWSVGCATGEEAYSLAILLIEEARRREEVPKIQVFATDLHERSLEKARDGFFPGDIESDVDAKRMKRFFKRESGGYRITKEVRELVVFAPHNLLADPPFSRCDLISCRNLLIYLQRGVQREVVELFHYALNPEGFLVLGNSETTNAQDLFSIKNKKACIYRKRNVPAPEPRLPVFPMTRARLPLGPPEPKSQGEPVAYGMLHQWMVERYAPPSLLVNPDDKVVHLSQHAGRYLVHPGGELTASIYKLVREELRIELRSAMHAARRDKAPRTTRAIPVVFDGEERPVVLHARPAQEPEQEGFALVIFEEREPKGEGEGPSDPARADSGEVEELQDELRLTQQRLQSIIEEYETGQEEMKAANEELQSTNEELRSTMEELETSKEELQSMNEELQTVNQENRHKVEELAQLSSDLQNLLTATEIATLFLDRDRRILRFTPKVAELFNIRETDRGRPISDLTHSLLYDELEGDTQRVLGDLVPVERNLRDQTGGWYLARVMPYRSTEDRIEGVVLTFIDVSDLKQAEEALRQLNETLEHRVEERTQDLRSLAGRLTRAEQQERRRLARVLHDDLQQQLHGVQLKLAHSRSRLEAGDVEAAREKLSEAEALLSQGVDTTRRLSVGLSPPILESENLGESLTWLTARMRELHGLEVDLSVGDILIADDDTRALLFQSIQELLFNVVKHAETGTARVAVVSDHDHVVAEVSDQGAGFDPGDVDDGHGTGLGLAGLRQRLGFVQGGLKVRSEPGAGTRVMVRIPHLARPVESEAS